MNTGSSTVSSVYTGVHGVSRAATPATGQDGSVTWTLDANGVLTFEDGKFADPGHSSARNWRNTSSVAYSITRIVFDDPTNTIFPVDSSQFFSGLGAVASISGIKDVDTSHVTNMSGMFSNMPALTSLDLSSFNTENVTDMSNMFATTIRLTNLDVSSLNTENVTNMSNMFSHMPALTSLDVSSFNTENVTTMSGMFSHMPALTSLDVSSFNTENVTDMSGMFANMRALERLTLGAQTDLDTNAQLPTSYLSPSQSSTMWTHLTPDTHPWTGTSTELLSRSRTPQGLGTYARDAAMDIRFDKNDPRASTAPAPISGRTIITTTIPTDVLSLTRYTFTGWNTNADGSGTPYKPGDTAYFLSGTHTLYAQWQVTPNGTITVKYQDTAGNPLQTDTTLTGLVGELYGVPTPTISGHTYTSANAPLTGTYGASPITITLTYTANTPSTPQPSTPSTPTDPPHQEPGTPVTDGSTGAGNEEAPDGTVTPAHTGLADTGMTSLTGLTAVLFALGAVGITLVIMRRHTTTTRR